MNDLTIQRIIRITITVVVFGLFAAIFVPFFKPLLMAALFAFALERLVSRFSLKKSSARYVPTLAILSVFFLVIASPLILIGFRLTTTIRGFTKAGLANSPLYRSVETLVHRAEVYVAYILQAFKIPEDSFSAPTDFLGQAGTVILASLANLAASAPELLLDLFVFSVALYFFLTEATWIRKTFSDMKILREKELAEIVRVIQRSAYATLVVSASLGAIQALIVATGGVVFGYSEFLLLFALTFFTSFIPVLGAAPVAVALALLSLAQGEISSMIGLLVVAAIAGSVDNVVKPFLVTAGNEESLNPVVSLLGIVGAVIVYGLPGLFLGPILMELALKIIPILFPEEPVA